MNRCFLFRLAVPALLTVGVLALNAKPASAGEALCPVIADNSIASYHGEENENTGAADRVKIKGRENQAIFKFDLSAIPKNVSVVRAVLSVKLAGKGYRINQIGYSTVPTDWVEGKNHPAKRAKHGFCCHEWPGPSTRSWGDPGSSILDVIHGNGGNVCGFTLARQAGKRWEIELPGRVIEALRADQPGGLILLDETGWWSGKWANIYIFSRESGKDGPRLKVTWGGQDTVAPSEPKIRSVTGDLLAGEMLLEITCGGDDGDRGRALGFDLRLLKGEKLSARNWKRGRPLPRYRIPRPKAAGTKERVWLRGLEPGAEYSVGIQAYDEGGNRSAVVSTPLARAAGPLPPPRLGAKELPVAKGGPLPLGDALQLWAVDELTKIAPLGGRTLDGAGYRESKAREGNHVWNGKEKKVVLHAARGETVSFRLAVELRGKKAVSGITLTPRKLQGPEGAAIGAGRFRLLREWYLKHGGAWYGAALPELKGKANGAFDLPARDNRVDGQRVQTILVELYVPKKARPGVYQGSIEVAAAGAKGDFPLELTVHDVALPDELSFIIELNSYGAHGKERFYATQRLAQRYRLGYNALSYSHSGNRSLPCVPDIKGKGAQATVADWSQWDEWMGPLLDGSLFKDLPRGAVPIPHFYLPFFESYPTSIYENYGDPRFFLDRHLKPGEKYDYNKWKFFVSAHDGYVADGFSKNWKLAAARIAGEYRKHFEAKGWTKTQLQIFFNNKHYGRKKAKRRNTSLWTLDEPSFGRDFRALGFLFRTFQKPFEGTTLNVVTRGDISRPQWQGDRLDGACDISVVSSAFYHFQPLIQRRRMERGARYWFYGGGPGPDRDLAQLAAVYLKNWTLGCEGGLAYWTSFHGNDWDEYDPLACVVSGNHGYPELAVATGRLAAQRRIQQDIELLNLLARKPGWSRRRVARAVAHAVNLSSETEAKGADDPGKTQFKGIRAADLARIRRAVLNALSAK